MEEENKTNPEEYIDYTDPHRRKLWYSERYRQRYEEKYRKKQEKVNADSIKPSQSPLIKQSSELNKITTEIVKETEKVEKEIAKEAEEFKLNKFWITIGVLALILAVFFAIFLFATPSVKAKYSPLDTISSSTSGMPSSVYYKNTFLLSVSGWESMLVYNGKSDRLFGNEQYKKIIFDDKGKAYTAISVDNEIRLEPLTSNPNTATKVGWFTNISAITTSEEKKFSSKKVSSTVQEDNGINTAGFEYSLFKGKPYMKVQFSADAENSSLLGNFAYGIVLRGYDVYLQNSAILKNDNEIIQLNKPVETVLYQGKNKTSNISSTLKSEVSKAIDTSRQAVSRKGSSYKINDSEYEIFYNSTSKQAIILYSPETLYFQNLFMWNVYQVYVPYNEGYSPLYVMVIENVDLSYDKNMGDWKIISKDLSTYADFYINDIVNEIEK